MKAWQREERWNHHWDTCPVCSLERSAGYRHSHLCAEGLKLAQTWERSGGYGTEAYDDLTYHGARPSTEIG